MAVGLGWVESIGRPELQVESLDTYDGRFWVSLCCYEKHLERFSSEISLCVYPSFSDHYFSPDSLRSECEAGGRLQDPIGQCGNLFRLCSRHVHGTVLSSKLIRKSTAIKMGDICGGILESLAVLKQFTVCSKMLNSFNNSAIYIAFWTTIIMTVTVIAFSRNVCILLPEVVCLSKCSSTSSQSVPFLSASLSVFAQ